jgi:hypothetical protein
MIKSNGEVTNTMFSPLYIQMIIHGSFSNRGICCATKGRITNNIPATIKIMPAKVKGWEYFKSLLPSLIVY